LHLLLSHRLHAAFPAVRQAMAGVGVACRFEQSWMLALVAANNHTDCVTGDPDDEDRAACASDAAAFAAGAVVLRGMCVSDRVSDLNDQFAVVADRKVRTALIDYNSNEVHLCGTKAARGGRRWQGRRRAGALDHPHARQRGPQPGA
jgi:hypothetical protein